VWLKGKSLKEQQENFKNATGYPLNISITARKIINF